MAAIIPIFSIDNLIHEGGTIIATLGVNKDSEIFNGHFPGRPVVPGACMLQLVKDVLEIALDRPMQLKRAGHLKFISMINPRSVSQAALMITYTIDENKIAASAQLHYHEAVCFKFQGTFTAK